VAAGASAVALAVVLALALAVTLLLLLPRWALVPRRVLARLCREVRCVCVWGGVVSVRKKACEGRRKRALQ
jgi:hypothetical protein